MRLPDVEMEQGDAPKTSLDPNTTCALFKRTGECKHGLKCRFLGSHSRIQEGGELELLVDEEKKAHVAASEAEVNFVDADTLRKIRTKKVCCHSRFPAFCTHADALLYSIHILLRMRTCKRSRTRRKGRRRRTTRRRGPHLLQSAQNLKMLRSLLRINPRQQLSQPL